MLNSNYQRLDPVFLPWSGRQVYMAEFNLEDPIMPKGIEDYLNPVRRLCKAAGASKGTAYLTVDEKVVEAGMSQRRPRPHVDGCFLPQAMDWGHGGGGWNHYCNSINTGKIGRMPVIVASSVPGCRVWKGQFIGEPKSDGDLSHIAQDLGEGEILPANVGYLLSGDCVHESMVFTESTKRTFIRIALPVDVELNLKWK
jgi:hypothetical protein